MAFLLSRRLAKMIVSPLLVGSRIDERSIRGKDESASE
jgi:hypothetical protein